MHLRLAPFVIGSYVTLESFALVLIYELHFMT